MSTTYNVFTKGHSSLEVTEHSNLLDIDMTTNDGEYVGVEDLTAAELVNMALKLLQIASYYCDDEVGLFETLVEVSKGENELHNYCNKLG